MSNATVSYIVDAPLPEDQSFTSLKNQGLNEIQTLAGHKWSNYNESDPGVTILDQLCYALTELGYCADFSIEDILTGSDGKIHYEGQFFEPQEILTCSPITSDDYRKLVVDQISGVNNIYIEPELNSEGDVTGSYASYIYLDESSTPTSDNANNNRRKRIASKVHQLLMRNRNLCEVFQKPNILKSKKIDINGKVLLEKNASPQSVYSTIIQVIAQYISPLVNQAGYKQLILEGLDPDQIFNGPELTHGWMSSNNALGDKRSQVRILELASIINQVDGVIGLESLTLTLPSDPADPNIPTGAQDDIDIPTCMVAEILPSKSFQLWQNSVIVTPDNFQQSSVYLRALTASHEAASVQASIDLYPALPSGNYRDIENYYSIQNTFPDIYAIGPNSIKSDMPSYRVAQSRQLKGYLMAYDQILANEFSQLAHVGDLFSFASSYKEANQWRVADPSINYTKFATTYYFQPLYKIPDVKPLLRGYDSFNYRYDASTSEQIVEREAWIKFCKDPFNQYIYQLRQSMESDQEAETRRDNMLSHLIARQGEDASEYDDMIKTCQWFGSDARTRIIVKSIWLQNMQNLSYYRPAAYHCNEANLLTQPGRYSITKNDFKNLAKALHNTPIPKLLERFIGPGYADKNALEQQIFDLLSSKKLSNNAALEFIKKIPITDVNVILQQLWEEKVFPPTIDGKLDQELMFEQARILPESFENYSTFELKINILLSLQHYLRPVAGKLCSLLDQEEFIDWLGKATPDNDNTYYLPDSDISVVRTNNKDQLKEGSQCVMDIVWPKNPGSNSDTSAADITPTNTAARIPPTKQDYQNHVDQLAWLANQRKGFLLIEHILLVLDQQQVKTLPSDYILSATLLFPRYITLFQQDNFKGFITSLIDLHWPAHVLIECLNPSFTGLSAVIDNFIPWHNGLAKGQGLAPPLPKPPPSTEPLSSAQRAAEKAKEERADQETKIWRIAARKLAKLLNLEALPPVSNSPAGNSPAENRTDGNSENNNNANINRSGASPNAN